VCIGCQNVLDILLHDTLHIFSHPTCSIGDIVVRLKKVEILKSQVAIPFTVQHDYRADF